MTTEMSIDEWRQPVSEHEEQKLVIQWARDMEQYCPELALLYAIPNEQALGWKKGKKGRYNTALTKLRQEGLQGGVPDLHLPIARQNYHSYYIEIKLPGKWPTKKQREWLVALLEQGHRVDLCTSADMVIDGLCNYLDTMRRFWY